MQIQNVLLNNDTLYVMLHCTLLVDCLIKLRVGGVKYLCVLLHALNIIESQIRQRGCHLKHPSVIKTMHYFNYYL